VQFPRAFEFTDRLLVLLADHSATGWFGDFQLNSEKERAGAHLAQSTTTVWSHIRAIRSELTNPDFRPVTGAAVFPVSNMKCLVFWGRYFLRFDEAYSPREEFAAPDDDTAAGFGGPGASGANMGTANYNSGSRVACSQNVVVWVPDDEAKTCMLVGFFSR
jgi:hypothetical protein